MKLHWSPKSPYVRKVMVCAHELGMVEQLTLIRSVAAMLKPNPDILRDNPLSKIPTLVLDDGSRLYDSVVICEYLNERGGGDLFPASGAAKWQALRWHALGDGMLDALILWRNERERSDAQRLEALIDAFTLKFDETLRVLQAEAPALASAPLSIGPITLACMLGYADFRFAGEAWRERAPALAEWYATLTARPSFQQTAPDFD